MAAQGSVSLGIALVQLANGYMGILTGPRLASALAPWHYPVAPLDM